jgi:CBS domain-containing protein
MARGISTFPNGIEAFRRLASLIIAEGVMRILEIASAPVFVAHPEQALAVAAREMRTRGVGALVVVDPRASIQRPVGILTDRDIVCGQLRRSEDLYCLTVEDVMTRDPLTLPAGGELAEAIEVMSARAVRRAPVVDDSGALVAILTLDDVLPVVAQELDDVAGIVRAQASCRRPSRDEPSLQQYRGYP